MKQEEIYQHNKIISIFMGGEVRSLGGVEGIWFEKSPQSGHHNLFLLEQLKYHSDWSWIMPVYKKCKEHLADNFEMPLMEDIREDLILSNLEDLHKHLYHLILWYSSQVKETIKQ